MASENTNLSLYELDRIFKRAKSIFFIGIGGISMSSLAQWCVYQGKSVFGYDRARSEECLRLEEVAHIRYCSTTDSVRGMDLVVFSNAIDDDCFELKSARKIGIPTVSRANFLSYVMSEHRVRIGVAGMHGKSTTTAMLAHIFRHAEKDPSVICGARMKEFNAAYRFGKRDYFIFEACEYMNSFLCFSPTDAVITNIDLDHTDFFDDVLQIQASFKEYVLSARRVFINADNELSECISHPYKVTFGIDRRADYMAKIDTGCQQNSFSVLRRGIECTHVVLKEYGRHNVYNALCAFAVAAEQGIDATVIACALRTFEGIKRRQELIKYVSTKYASESHRVPLFLDYAHHPTEIKASLDAFRDMGYKRILCIFQSHTFSRTYALYDKFSEALSGVAYLVMLPIYSAREQNSYPISSEGFAKDAGAIYMTEYEKIAEYVAQSDADVVIIMGAGDVEALKKYII